MGAESEQAAPDRTESARGDAESLATRLAAVLQKDPADRAALAALLGGQRDLDIVAGMEGLTPEQCARVVDALGDECAAGVLTLLDAERLAEIVPALAGPRYRRLLACLPPRQAARVLVESPDEFAGVVDRQLPKVAADAQARAQWPEGSAGRMMTNAFVRLSPDMTVAEALQAVRRTDRHVDIPSDLYAVERSERGGRCTESLKGVISIRDLAMAEPTQKVASLMTTDPVTVVADEDDDAAAGLIAKYKFSALPVLDRDGHLVGVIPVDDLMLLTTARLHRLYARAVGTDAEAMQKATPWQAATRRVPWLLGTMLLELGAGLVIAHFNHVLERVILLASFMPVISAIAGNVGLQAAAITVRALDTGQMSLRRSGAALVKESSVTLLMAIVCAVVLGGIGVIWSRHLMFGVVIAIALGCSMLTACLMGTLIPMVSKRLGFDPATTAGPFETAFQDIIGFGVFLGLATLLLR